MKTSLRVAVWHNLPSGGGKRALYDQVRGLVARGHYVEAWCPSTADRTYLPLSELVDEHVLDMEFLPTPLPFHPTALAPLKRNLRALTRHARAVATEIGDSFDVALVGSSQFVAVAPVGAHLRIPSVLYLQEPNRALYEASFRSNDRPRGEPGLPWLAGGRIRAAAVLLGRAEREAIYAYDRVLVNSHFSRDSLLRTFGIASQVCRLGVDATRLQPIPNPARDYVVGLGAFVPEKNIELVIRALATLTPSPPLTWVGNGLYSDAYLDSLRRLADELAVPFTTRLRVSDAELVALVANARMMMYAPRLDPFGLAPLEANACGVPVVGAAEGGVRETIAHGVNGLLAAPTASALGEAAAQLWENPAQAATLGQQARSHVLAHWSLETAIDRLEAHLYAESGAQVACR